MRSFSIMAAAAAAPAAADSAKRLRLDDEPDALAAAATTPLPAPGGATLAGDAARPGEEKRQPVCRVLLYNVAKKGNVGEKALLAPRSPDRTARRSEFPWAGRAQAASSAPQWRLAPRKSSSSDSTKFGSGGTACARRGAAHIMLWAAQTFGSQGTTAFVKYLHFGAVEEAVKYLERCAPVSASPPEPAAASAPAHAHAVARRSQGSELVGVEIDASAVEVSQRPFRGDSCFVFGNE